MRFVLILLLLTLIALPVSAAPGDTFNAEAKWTNQPATKRQFSTHDIPTAPPGFSVKKSVSNLGNIVAFAVIDKDIFVADADQDRILRLKSRNANNAFETRAEFLIGFDNIQDLVAVEDVLYMSDNSGIWEISVGEMLMASGKPKLIYANPAASKDRTRIAISPVKKALIIGHKNRILALNLDTGQLSPILKGSWQLNDIAVSPGGSIWASISENGSSYIAPVRSNLENEVRLKLPLGATATHIQFWKQDIFPENWPRDWSSDLIFSIKGSRPMVARAQFNYGDVDASFTSFIDGFSIPSRIIGRREYWGTPAAIDILNNGQLIFAEREHGTLWILEKVLVEKPRPKTVIETKEISKPVPEQDKKSSSPELLKGSSIQSASGLETDDLLKKPELEKSDDKQKKPPN